MGMVLSRLGHLGRLVWHIPTSMNLAFRGTGDYAVFGGGGTEGGVKSIDGAFEHRGVLAGVCDLHDDDSADRGWNI